MSVYFNLRNTLPKFGTFLLGHPVYVYIYIYVLGVNKNRMLRDIFRPTGEKQKVNGET